MLKLGIQLKEDKDTLNISLIDPTKKQLEAASENEKIIAQVIKILLANRLLELLEEQTKEKIIKKRKEKIKNEICKKRN